MSNAIVVRVPTIEDHCFLAIPANGFDALARAIEDAAARSELKCVRLPRGREGDPDFIETIVEKIRSARVVVAVVTREPATGAPNPNVFYELGLASALGKPTLVLTADDPRERPADLAKHGVVRYSGDDPRSLADQVSEPLLRLLNRLKSSILIDPRYSPDISVARAHHWRIIEPEWWDLLATTLRFAKDVHNAFQPFDTGQLDPLLRQLARLADAPVLAAQALDLEVTWGVARNAYDALMNSNGLARPAERFTEVEFAYPGMKRMMPEVPKRLSDSEQHYRAIRKRLEAYQSLICRFDGETTLRTQVRAAGGGEAVWDAVYSLSIETKRIIVSADHMLLALLGLMLEGD